MGSQKNIMVVSRLISMCCGSNGDNNDDDIPNEVEMDVTTIPEEPLWLSNAGISRGYFHDKQALGIVMPAGSTLSIQQDGTINPPTDSLNLVLLGDDSSKETGVTSIPPTGEVIMVTAQHDLVPFIQTPFTTSSLLFKIDFAITQGADAIKLPIYSKNGEEEANFFTEWDNSNSPFALLSSDNFQMLVPAMDKEVLKFGGMEGFDSLLSLMNYYDNNVIGSLDAQIGLLDQPQIATDTLPPIRFFFKADISGGAVENSVNYTDHEVSVASASIRQFLILNHWPALTAIAQGYVPDFTSRGINGVEPTVNLLAVEIQYANLGITLADSTGWLWDNGQKSAIENEILTALNNFETFDTMAEVRFSTVMLIMMRQKAGGIPAFAYLNSQYRIQPDTTSHYADLLLQYYGVFSKFDFAPVLERWGVPYLANQAEDNRTNGYIPVNQLIDLVPTTSIPQTNTQQQEIQSIFNNVDNTELTSLGLIGSLALTFDATSVAGIVGQPIRLLEVGVTTNTVISTANVETPVVVFENVPIGVYLIEYPTAITSIGIPEQYYVNIRDQASAITITFVENDPPPLL